MLIMLYKQIKKLTFKLKKKGIIFRIFLKISFTQILFQYSLYVLYNILLLNLLNSLKNLLNIILQYEAMGRLISQKINYGS